MKLSIDGMKHLDMNKLANFVREWEDGDILAYGLDHITQIAKDHLSKYGSMDTAIDELMAFERLIRAMLASDSYCGIIVCKSLLHMSASMEDLIPELESADFESGDYIYVRRVTHSFEEFCKTGKDTDDINQYMPNLPPSGKMKISGRVYLEDISPLVLIRRPNGLGWNVQLGNREHVSKSLSRIEGLLYNFAVDNDLI